MKKWIVALMMCALAPLGLATPAYASQHFTPNTCDTNGGVGPTGNPYNITACVQYKWHDQVDGTGVSMTTVFIDLTHGCPGDTDDDPVGDLVLTSYDHSGYVLDTHPMDDMLDCHADRDLVGKIQTNDIGETLLYLSGTVRVNQAGNLDLINWCTIRPNAADTCQTGLQDQ
jgi:hypothetical protein